MNQIAVRSEALSIAKTQDSSGGHAPLDMRMILTWDGNLADLVDDDLLARIGSDVVTEAKMDDSNRRDWLSQAKRAVETARQKARAPKTYPLPKSANIQFPALTTACLQFHARAYGAIVRGDEVVSCKVSGKDQDGEKASRAQRVAEFTNDQLSYQCSEWEPGTDVLLLQLPITGMAFRKVYWDTKRNRPRLDYASGIDVIVPIDAPSLELAPRVTHILRYYPHDIATKIASEEWLECTYTRKSSDSQAAEIFYEQCRWEDLDKDGIEEPYIVTVHVETAKVVRIDPAFDDRDVITKTDRRTGQDRIIAVNRLLPWIEYTFLPDPEGSVYGMGFGMLLEQVSETVNSLLNQMIDAGHWANTATGFLGSGFKKRGGDIQVTPNEFFHVDGVTDVREGVMQLQFPGPSAVQFQLLEFLLAAAKDITSVKDVLTGDAPGQQPATSTLALIEQGMQVFTSIYKRIYRSMTRELQLLTRLNARYLQDEDYQKFVDELPEQGEDEAMSSEMGHNGGPPLDDDAAMAAMGGPPPGAAPMGQPPVAPPMPGMDAGAPAAPAIDPGMQPGATPPGAPAMPPQPGMSGPDPMAPPPGAPQGPAGPPPGMDQMAPPPMIAKPKKPVSVESDFNLDDMDIRPVADPNAVTDMQRMAKAQVLLMFKDDPRADGAAIMRAVTQAANIPDSEQYIPKNNPGLEQQAQMASRMQGAEAAGKEADAQLKAAQAKKFEADAATAQEGAQFERGMRERELMLKEKESDLKDREVAIKEIEAFFRQFELEMDEQARALDAYRAEMEGTRTEADIEHKFHEQRRATKREDRDFMLRRSDLAHNQRMAEHEATESPQKEAAEEAATGGE